MNNPAQALEARLIADWIYGQAVRLEREKAQDEFGLAIATIFKELAQDIRRGKHRGDPTQHARAGRPGEKP